MIIKKMPLHGASDQIKSKINAMQREHYGNDHMDRVLSIEINDKPDWGAELILAYDGPTIVGFTLWRSVEHSRYVNTNADLNLEISELGHDKQKLILVLMAAVVPAYQNQGIGTQMYDAMCESAKAKDFVSIMPVMPYMTGTQEIFLMEKGSESLKLQKLKYIDEQGYQYGIWPL